MIEEVLMGLGAAVAFVGILVWTAGELIGVVKDDDTTSHYVRRGRRKSGLIKAGVLIFTSGLVLFFAWLWLHFNMGLW